MIIPLLGRRLNLLFRNSYLAQIKNCHSSGVFGIKDLIISDKLENVKLKQVSSQYQDEAMVMIKKYYMSEHVLVQARKMDLSNDKAFDEYLIAILKQGNTLLARTDDGTLAGVCVGYASSAVETKNLRTYAFYRQDPNTKDFLYFTAKLQETPNLWETFKQQKIFEVKMLAVVPEFRRLGLASMMVEQAKKEALDQGYKVIRMDCINPYDYKIAEHCMFQCIVKFPLHKLRGSNAPFIKRSSDHNRFVRVYVDVRSVPDVPDSKAIKARREDLESMIE